MTVDRVEELGRSKDTKQNAHRTSRPFPLPVCWAAAHHLVPVDTNQLGNNSKSNEPN